MHGLWSRIIHCLQLVLNVICTLRAHQSGVSALVLFPTLMPSPDGACADQVCSESTLCAGYLLGCWDREHEAALTVYKCSSAFVHSHLTHGDGLGVRSHRPLHECEGTATHELHVDPQVARAFQPCEALVFTWCMRSHGGVKNHLQIKKQRKA